MVETRRGFGIASASSPDAIRASAMAAESLGYAAFWVNDTSSGNGLDALARVEAVTSRIQLGVGVIPLSRRTPASIVQQVRSLTAEPEEGQEFHLSLDRLRLGIGSGSGPGGIERVRAGIRALKAALDIDIIIAALGPKMCRLAGGEADGVLFNWLTPEYARTLTRIVDAGAAADGRKPPERYAYVRVALGPEAAERLSQEAAFYAGIPAYAAHFARMGSTPVEASIAADTPGALQTALAAWDGVLDQVIVRAVTANDTPEEFLALARAAAPSG